MTNLEDKIPLKNIVGEILSGEWGDEAANGVGYPVLRTTNFTNDGIISYENVVIRNISREKAEKKFLTKGDVIIEKSGGSDKQPVGRVVFFEGEEKKYLFNNFTGVLRVRDQNIWFPKYIFYSLFNSYQKGDTIKFENRTTGIHNLQTDRFINRQTIILRSIDSQKNICSILDKFLILKSICQQQLARLDQLAKSRFIEMFGDPGTNPCKWQTASLLDFGSCKNGMNYHANENGIKINCLGVGDFQDKSVIRDTSDLPVISLDNLPNTDYLLKDDDIVFVRSNGNKALVGRCVAVYPGNTPTVFSGFCIRFRQTSSTVKTAYLLAVLRSTSVRKLMAGRGANIQNLNQQILASLRIPLPPLELQNEFAAFIEQLDKSKVTIRKSIEKLETTYRALLQEYFG